MTRADFLRAEELAAAIAATMCDCGPNGGRDGPDLGVDCDGALRGDQRDGWAVGGWPYDSRWIDPPDNIDGWAGYLAAYMVPR